MLSLETRFGGNVTGLPAGLLPPAPAPLPSLASALSRRAALFGAVALPAVAMVCSTTSSASDPDAALIAQADAFRALCERERHAWDALDDDEWGETPAVSACRTLSQACCAAGEALAEMSATTPAGLAAKASAMLALVGLRLDTQARLSEHHQLVASILRDAARLGAGGTL